MPQPTPMGHLPGRLTSLAEVNQLQPILRKIQDLIIRLQVQAFIVVIHDLFNASPDLIELTINGDDEPSPMFSSFDGDGDGDFTEELREATDLVDNIGLSPECFMPFQGEVLVRNQLADQLASAYDVALTPDQKQGGGNWVHFWGGLVPLETDFR